MSVVDYKTTYFPRPGVELAVKVVTQLACAAKFLLSIEGKYAFYAPQGVHLDI
jgi:hypothetical protein